MGGAGRVSDVRKLLSVAFTRFPDDDDSIEEEFDIIARRLAAPRLLKSPALFAAAPSQPVPDVLQNAELLSLILRAASLSSDAKKTSLSDAKKSSVALFICRYEGVCSGWRDCVASDGLWAEFARTHWRECENLKGVTSWKKFCTSRMQLTRQPKQLHWRKSDLQVMVTVRLERTTLLRGCKPSKSLLRTTLAGSAAAWAWPHALRFEWRGVPLSLPKGLAGELSAHGWSASDHDAADDNGLVGLIEGDEDTEYVFTLSVSLFRASDQKMCRLYSTERCRKLVRHVEGFRWSKKTDLTGGGVGLVLQSGLELVRETETTGRASPTWDFHLAVAEEGAARDEESSHGFGEQRMLRLLNTSLEWG